MNLVALLLASTLVHEPGELVPAPSLQGFNPSELEQIGKIESNVFYVLPSSRKSENGKAAIVTVVRSMTQHKAAALFVIFDCAKHEFSIPAVSEIKASEGRLFVGEASATGGEAAAFTPTKDSPWGEAAEKAACGSGA